MCKGYKSLDYGPEGNYSYGITFKEATFEATHL